MDRQDIIARLRENEAALALRDDLRTTYAVTCWLEIVSEASRRLPDELKTQHPSIQWRDMAAAGNVYRHEYEDVAVRDVWDTLSHHLSPLRIVIEQELEGLRGRL